MGCKVFGVPFVKTSSMCLGIPSEAARSDQSLEIDSACSCVGTSPVNKSQKRLSGKGSCPPSTLGNTFFTSGIDKPRNLIPCIKNVKY